MREIKFRAWDTYNKEMLEVQGLDYEDSYNGQPMVRTIMYNDYFDIEDMILMQYIGLHDKNGKEIYEGDIISNGTEKCIVVWVKDYAGFMLKLINKDYENREWTNPIIDLRKNDEVIGNVWEDSDLLNDSKNTKSN